jgi:hypothetical protein
MKTEKTQAREVVTGTSAAQPRTPLERAVHELFEERAATNYGSSRNPHEYNMPRKPCCID